MRVFSTLAGPGDSDGDAESPLFLRQSSFDMVMSFHAQYPRETSRAISH
jgi:hypothetical protein